jgi:hypothetical protein
MKQRVKQRCRKGAMKGMKRFMIIGACLLISAAVSVGSVLASSIVLDSNFPSDYARYTFIDETGTGQTEYVAPYPATLDGKAAYLVCFDINNATYIGRAYTGVLQAAVTDADKEAVWLMDHLLGKTPKDSASYLGPISMAIWQIEFPSSNKSDGTLTMPHDPAAQTWVARAETAVAAGYAPDMLIFTPNDRSSQRFGVVNPVAEPGTVILIGSGLIGLTGISRKTLVK